MKRHADGGACGSAGFLCESFAGNANLPIGDLKNAIQEIGVAGLTTEELETPQNRAFIGKEKKSIAYVIAIMNMILHGSDAPNIIHVNMLVEQK